MNKEHTRIDLVEGGNVFRQGDHATLGFIPRDYAGNIVDLTGKLIDVSILGRKGIMFTSTATFDSAAQVIRVLIDEVLDYGDHRIEFTVTDPNDADYRRKFPSSEYDGRIKITPGADNMDFVGVAMTTVTQLRNEQEAAQVSYEQTVDGKITGIESTVAELESTVETGIGAFTQDSEVVLARGGEVNLGARLDKTNQQLADTATKAELANVLNGSPKGTYATLADLQTAYPSGADGVYIVTANGHIYSWDGTVWADRGLYQAVGIAESSVTPDMLALKKKLSYFAPADFNWKDHPLVGKLYTDGDGRFKTEFDVSELAPTGKKYYVDIVDGLDTNDGLTPATALQRVHTAAKKVDAVEVIVDSGYYDDGYAMNGWAIDKNLSIKAAEGAEVVLSTRRNQEGVWTKTAGYTNIYQVSRSLVLNVFDKKFKDSYGDDFQMLPTNDLTTLDNAPGRMFYSSSILYVHTSDSRIPDVDVTVFLDLYNVQNRGGLTLYLEGIKFEGGKYPVLTQNETGTPTMTLAKNCEFKYSGATGSDGATNYGGTTIYQGCLVAKNSDDGFSYTIYNGLPTNGIEIDCLARNNGRTGNNDNGSTAHDGSNVIRLNSTYAYNVGPNIGDVGGSHSWNMDCLIAESKATTDAGNKGVVSASNNGLIGSKIWLDNCSVFGNVSDIYSDIDNPLYVRNTTFGTTNGLQVIY